MTIYAFAVSRPLSRVTPLLWVCPNLQARGHARFILTPASFSQTQVESLFQRVLSEVSGCPKLDYHGIFFCLPSPCPPSSPSTFLLSLDSYYQSSSVNGFWETFVNFPPPFRDPRQGCDFPYNYPILPSPTASLFRAFPAKFVISSASRFQRWFPFPATWITLKLRATFLNH